MKKICIAVLISVLALGGCGKTEDKNNMEPTETIDAPNTEQIEIETESEPDNTQNEDTEVKTNTETIEQAKETAMAHYTDTVFEVVSMDIISQTENTINFEVCVRKDGIIQDPNRTIQLQLNNGEWEVINEGY